MKNRSGFVSNSSSSSFIVGAAKIESIDKFNKYLVDKGLTLGDDFFIFDRSSTRSEVKLNTSKRRLTVDSFETSVEISTGDTYEEDKYVILNIINNEGDTGQFSPDYDDGCIDYDIKLDYFSDDERKKYLLFQTEDSGIDISKSEVQYGAARNG